MTLRTSTQLVTHTHPFDDLFGRITQSPGETAGHVPELIHGYAMLFRCIYPAHRPGPHPHRALQTVDTGRNSPNGRLLRCQSHDVVPAPHHIFHPVDESGHGAGWVPRCRRLFGAGLPRRKSGGEGIGWRPAQ